MRRTRTALCVILSTLALAAAARAQGAADDERPTSLLEGRVTFALPRSWVVRQHVSTKGLGRAHFALPHPAAEKAGQRSEAILMTSLAPEGVGVRHLSDGVHQNLYEGLAVTSDSFDGGDWRTMVWTFTDKVPYVVLNRFGLVNRVSVELLVVFPAGGADPKWLERAVADFNAMCASLKIDGRNKFESPVKADKLTRRQGMDAKARRP